MYLVVIAVFSLVLTLPRPPYAWLTAPWAIGAAVTAATLVPALAAWLVGRHVRTLLDEHPAHPGDGQAAYARGNTLVQGLLAIGHGGLFLVTTWMPLCNQVPLVGRWVVVPSLLSVLPLLLSIALVWLGLYPADRSVRQIAVEVYLYRGRPVRPVWHVGRYLAYNFRHQVLFILIPMLLILAAADTVGLYEQEIRALIGLRYAPDMLVGLAALLVAVIAPEILRHVWVTQRLPQGPLRDRLEMLCRRMRLRIRDVLVWRSGGMIVNAAVMGVIPPLRYVLITDAMLEQMDDAQIEAVFGHEAGHVKHHHIPCFLLFALISGCIVTIFSTQTQGLSRTDPQLYTWLLACLGVLLAAKWGLLFGWVSRRFERQADTYGVRTLTLAGLPCVQACALHTPGTPSPRALPLCVTAAHVFGAALHDVAVLNGIQPEAFSWRHSSIASRARFLAALAQDPQRHARFQRSVRRVQFAILLLAAAFSVWAAYEIGVWAWLARWLHGP